MLRLTQLIRNKSWDSNLKSLAPVCAPNPEATLPFQGWYTASAQCKLSGLRIREAPSQDTCGLYAWASGAGRREKKGMSLGWSGQGWVPGEGGILDRENGERAWKLLWPESKVLWETQGREHGLKMVRKGARRTWVCVGRASPQPVSCQVACDFWEEAIAVLFMFLPPGHDPDFICRSDLGS